MLDMTEPEGDGAPATPSDVRPGGRGVATAPAGARRPRRRISVVGVLGELLITAGVLVLMFLGWQLWLQDILVGGQLHQEAVQQTKEWNKKATAPVAGSNAIPVSTAPGNAQVFAYLLVPRWNEPGQADYYRPIAQGIGVADVLNKYNLGHYPTTQMPGQAGNFAIASHRSAYGGNLHLIHQLHVGDHIFVETQDGWYQYSFRNLEYVQPTGVGVLDPVPQTPGVQPTDRVITLTSCNPFYSTAERIVAYGMFDKFYPRDPSKPGGGAPAEIVKTVEGGHS